MMIVFNRYCTGNVSLSALHKPYDASLPSFLRERPQELIDYYLEAESRSTCIYATQIEEVSEVQFRVGLSKNLVDISLPSCECFSWLNNNFPCKHMLAVCRNFNKKLPMHYMSQPWFCIDQEVVESSHDTSITGMSQQDMSSDADDCDFSRLVTIPNPPEPLANHSPPVDIAVYSESPPLELPSRKTAKSLAGECRELLDHIRSHTYLISDQDRLSNLRDILKSASLICKGSTEKVDQLAVHNIQQDSKSQNPTKRPHPQDNTSDSNTELKIRRKRSVCSGRVGVRAEAMRASIDVGSIYETPQTTAL
ncbi:uncharacterized protein [Watersipora subatra]|uniref:uncharacterized protein n=1 Tax=Watersipora subatra TaxID=2589382 RepID=UPI00355B9CA3